MIRYSMTYLFFAFFLISCGREQDVKEDEIRLYGEIEDPRSQEILVRASESPVSPEWVELDKILLKNGRFESTISWESPGQLILVHDEQEMTIYMAPGQELGIYGMGEQFGEEMDFSGSAKASNVFMHEEEPIMSEGIRSLQQEGFQKEPEAFLEMADDLYSGAYNRLQEAFPENSDGDYSSYVENQKMQIKYNQAALKLAYVQFRRQQQQEVPDDYFDFLDEVEKNNESAIGNQHYTAFLQTYINYRLMEDEALQNSIQSETDYYQVQYSMAEDLFDGKVREFVRAAIIHRLYSQGHTDAADALMAEFNTHTPDSEFKAVLEQSNEKADQLSPGNPAPEFTYPDLEGREVSLSDFKGNIVYLDVWASWCSPCLREFPHTADLYEKFKDEDVTFLYVSIDKERSAWKKAVDEHNIKGVNLYAGEHFDASIIKDYNISGIPRYIIIDDKGNLFNNNAPRPSGDAAKEIRKALDQ